MPHTPSDTKQKITAWLELTRFDKPVGTELVLYSTLWALFLAAAELGELPKPGHLAIFALGAVFMRAAGCAINDFADRRVDGQVKRTKSRPLADGRLSARTAVLTFVGLALLSASLLLLLPRVVTFWALVAVCLAFIYPFMKRYTHLPQVVLAAAFGWGIPMAYAATVGTVPALGWIAFGAYMCWTVAYDTEYAMCDRDDDLRIGVKSTAILFGCLDVLIICLLNAGFVLGMAYVLARYYGAWSVLGLAPVLGLFAYHYTLIRDRDRLKCFAAFRHNAWVGRYVFLLVFGLSLWQAG